MSSDVVDVYTDGACSGNPGPGGWGALIVDRGEEKEIWGYDRVTTNNKMELLAAVMALKSFNDSRVIRIYTDSKYVCNGITTWIKSWEINNWIKSDKKPVLNVELWKSLVQESSKHTVNWCWVKGHSDNRGNIRADMLANKGKNFAIELLRNK